MKALAIAVSSAVLGAGAAWRFKPTPPPDPASASSAPAVPPDVRLVHSLLGEKLTQRTFSFATVVGATSGTSVLPLDDSPPHQRVIAALSAALDDTLAELSQADSPVRGLRRINEASRFFEEGLRRRLDAVPGMSCGIPLTRFGSAQRSGYPDLELIDEASGTVFYIDPKLVEQSSIATTLRSFYFEPKDETLKVTRDAVHLLVGIEHDGRAGEWTFSKWRLVDLSGLQVRLKAEFQASNADLYQDRETGLSMPRPDR
jgi:hypothetical protein